MTNQELFKKFNSSKQGLTSAQAIINEKFGKNILETQKKNGFLKKFFLQFKNLMIIILLISAVISTIVSLVTAEYADLFEGGIIFAIVILNAIIGVIQENKAEAALDLLNAQTAPKSRVCRDNGVVLLNSTDVVVGDVVLLKSGDFVPADIILFESSNLKTNESALTGESCDVIKDHKFLQTDSTPLAEKSNMCFKGTSVTSGNGKGMVVAVGKNTEMGKISKLLNQKRDKTPLEKNMEKIGKVITYAVLAVVAVVFFTQLIFNKNFDFMQAFLTAVALAVAAIPESLPAVITIIMALGVEKLAKHGAIVKTLSSVETLGSCTYLCTDKTGTLTENKMTVKGIYINHKLHYSNVTDTDFNLLLTAINCCNNATQNNNGFIGDATETSLKNFVAKCSPSLINSPATKLDELPFDSSRKLMSTLHEINGKKLVFCKGAFDYLIPHCSHILNNGKHVPLTIQDKLLIENAHNKMASSGERVIAVAYKQSNELNENNLTFIGLVGIVDPPKTETFMAIKQCFSAGLVPVMITGDHPETAFAIAKELKIATHKTQVLTGADIDSMTTKELCKTIKNYRVFARVTPSHKTKIVQALKKSGNIVGFAGDGINDAPSIKQANIGVCMGNGTDVTKSVADLVISTNDYSTIVLAIKQGRTIFSNIQKTLLFLISTNMVEVLGIFVCAVILPSATFLLPSQILFINLVTDSLPAFALGLEKSEKDIMQKPPRNPNSNIFTGIGWHILLQGFAQTFIVLLMFVIGLNIWDNNVASTMVFITICLMQLIHAINCKTLRSLTKINILKNKTFNISFVIILAAILIISLLPIGQLLFGLVRLNGLQWLIVSACSLFIVPIVEVCKYIINHPLKTRTKKATN